MTLSISILVTGKRTSVLAGRGGGANPSPGVLSTLSYSWGSCSGWGWSRRILLVGEGRSGLFPWKDWSKSGELLTLLAGSQVSSSLGYPFQWTRYWRQPRRHL